MESVVYNRENLAKFRSACQSLFDILSSVEDDKERYKPYSPLELDMKLNNAVNLFRTDNIHMWVMCHSVSSLVSLLLLHVHAADVLLRADEWMYMYTHTHTHMYIHVCTYSSVELAIWCGQSNTYCVHVHVVDVLFSAVSSAQDRNHLSHLTQLCV